MIFLVLWNISGHMIPKSPLSLLHSSQHLWILRPLNIWAQTLGSRWDLQNITESSPEMSTQTHSVQPIESLYSSQLRLYSSIWGHGYSSECTEHRVFFCCCCCCFFCCCCWFVCLFVLGFFVCLFLFSSKLKPSKWRNEAKDLGIAFLAINNEDWQCSLHSGFLSVSLEPCALIREE